MELGDLTADQVYRPSDIVWVKLSGMWWPAEVQDQSTLDPEVTEGLKKPPLAVVKYLTEDFYGTIKSLDHIYHYNCKRKMEFLKLGFKKYSGMRNEKNMSTYPAVILEAEKLTKGDLNILEDPEFVQYLRPCSEGEESPKVGLRHSLPSRPSSSKAVANSHKSTPASSAGERTWRLLQATTAVKVPPVEGPVEKILCGRCDYSTPNFGLFMIHQQLKHQSIKTGSAAKPKKEKRSREPACTIQSAKKKKTPKLTKKPHEQKPVLENDECNLPIADFLKDWDEEEPDPPPNDEAQNPEECSNNAGPIPAPGGTEADKEQSVAAVPLKTTSSCFDFDDEDEVTEPDVHNLKFGQKLPRLITPEKSKQALVDDEPEELQNMLSEVALPEIPTLPTIRKSYSRRMSTAPNNDATVESANNDLSKHFLVQGPLQPKNIKAEDGSVETKKTEHEEDGLVTEATTAEIIDRQTSISSDHPPQEANLTSDPTNNVEEMDVDEKLVPLKHDLLVGSEDLDKITADSERRSSGELSKKGDKTPLKSKKKSAYKNEGDIVATSEGELQAAQIPDHRSVTGSTLMTIVKDRLVAVVGSQGNSSDSLRARENTNQTAVKSQPNQHQSKDGSRESSYSSKRRSSQSHSSSKGSALKASDEDRKECATSKLNSNSPNSSKSGTKSSSSKRKRSSEQTTKEELKLNEGNYSSAPGIGDGKIDGVLDIKPKGASIDESTSSGPEPVASNSPISKSTEKLGRSSSSNRKQSRKEESAAEEDIFIKVKSSSPSRASKSKRESRSKENSKKSRNDEPTTPAPAKEGCISNVEKPSDNDNSLTDSNSTSIRMKPSDTSSKIDEFNHGVEAIAHCGPTTAQLASKQLENDCNSMSHALTNKGSSPTLKSSSKKKGSPSSFKDSRVDHSPKRYKTPGSGSENVPTPLESTLTERKSPGKSARSPVKSSPLKTDATSDGSADVGLAKNSGRTKDKQVAAKDKIVEADQGEKITKGRKPSARSSVTLDECDSQVDVNPVEYTRKRSTSGQFVKNDSQAPANKDKELEQTKAKKLRPNDVEAHSSRKSSQVLKSQSEMPMNNKKHDSHLSNNERKLLDSKAVQEKKDSKRKSERFSTKEQPHVSSPKTKRDKLSRSVEAPETLKNEADLGSPIPANTTSSESTSTKKKTGKSSKDSKRHSPATTSSRTSQKLNEKKTERASSTTPPKSSAVEDTAATISKANNLECTKGQRSLKNKDEAETVAVLPAIEEPQSLEHNIATDQRLSLKSAAPEGKSNSQIPSQIKPSPNVSETSTISQLDSPTNEGKLQHATRSSKRMLSPDKTGPTEKKCKVSTATPPAVIHAPPSELSFDESLGENQKLTVSLETVNGRHNEPTQYDNFGEEISLPEVIVTEPVQEVLLKNLDHQEVLLAQDRSSSADDKMIVATEHPQMSSEERECASTVSERTEMLKQDSFRNSVCGKYLSPPKSVVAQEVEIEIEAGSPVRMSRWDNPNPTKKSDATLAVGSPGRRSKWDSPVAWRRGEQSLTTGSSSGERSPNKVKIEIKSGLRGVRSPMSDQSSLPVQNPTPLVDGSGDLPGDTLSQLSREVVGEDVAESGDKSCELNSNLGVPAAPDLPPPTKEPIQKQNDSLEELMDIASMPVFLSQDEENLMPLLREDPVAPVAAERPLEDKEYFAKMFWRIKINLIDADHPHFALGQHLPSVSFRDLKPPVPPGQPCETETLEKVVKRGSDLQQSVKQAIHSALETAQKKMLFKTSQVQGSDRPNVPQSSSGGARGCLVSIKRDPKTGIVSRMITKPPSDAASASQRPPFQTISRAALQTLAGLPGATGPAPPMKRFFRSAGPSRSIVVQQRTGREMPRYTLTTNRSTLSPKPSETHILLINSQPSPLQSLANPPPPSTDILAQAVANNDLALPSAEEDISTDNTPSNLHQSPTSSLAPSNTDDGR